MDDDGGDDQTARAEGEVRKKGRKWIFRRTDADGRTSEWKREGGRADRATTTTTGGPRESCQGKGAAVGGRGRLPSLVDDWMDSHSSANVNKAIDGTDRTTPLYKHSTKSRRHSGLCGFVSSRSPTSNCISISETSACFITRPRAR